jgi:hypothetical protein
VELERTPDRKQQQQPDLNRNYHVATCRADIREFIRRRASRSSESSCAASSPGKAASPCRGSPGKVLLLPGCSPAKDLDEMDAWEISMRLDMADIQRKYRYRSYPLNQCCGSGSGAFLPPESGIRDGAMVGSGISKQIFVRAFIQK